MSLAHAKGLAEKSEAAQKEATDYLTPYLKDWFALEEETSRHFSKNEAEYDYDFLRIDGGFFVFQTEDYDNEYGEYQGTHSVYVPQSFIENPAEYSRNRRDDIAREKEAAIKKKREETEAKIARLRADLEREEAKLADHRN